VRACAYALAMREQRDALGNEAGRSAAAAAHTPSNTRCATACIGCGRRFPFRVRSVVAANKISCHRVYHGPTAAQRCAQRHGAHRHTPLKSATVAYTAQGTRAVHETTCSMHAVVERR
jgi:hypothetical protein